MLKRHSFYILAVIIFLMFGQCLGAYDQNNFKILIVPGHDNESKGGAQFKDIREADMNLKVAGDLYKYLSEDGHFRVFITRDKNGYKDEAVKYLSDNYSSILSFRNASKDKMNNFLENGIIKKIVGVDHNYASEDDSVKLYAINKWADDNGMDLVIHIHFNDYPNRKLNRVGEYSGFSIYIPEKQLPNYEKSFEIVNSVFSQLKKYFPVSDLPKEDKGIIEDQELIAVGSNLSLSSPVFLVEYGYIYESQFINPKIQPLMFKELAYQTYQGIKNYFEPIMEEKTAIFPYTFKNQVEKGLKNNPDAWALQMALLQEGVYPPSGFTKNECGLTGNFGKCTEESVIAFQRKYDIPQTGSVGPFTLSKLNNLFNFSHPKTAENFSYKWEKDLYYGLTDNNDIQALQNALYIEGVYDGPISGNSFELTRKAVIKFQKKYNFNSVPNTGYVGPFTRRALNEIYSK